MEDIYTTLRESLEKDLELLELKLKNIEPYTNENSNFDEIKFLDLPDRISEARLQFAEVERNLKNFSLAENSFTPEKHHLEEYEIQYRKCRAKFRSSILKSKQLNDKYNQELLLKNNNGSTLRNRKLKKDSHEQKGLIKKATSVTDSLKRTSELLQLEIEKSSTSYKVLSDSSKLLSDTNTAYSFIENTLVQSKSLLKNLEWNDLLDYIILWVGFMIFLSTVLYVVTKRIPLPFGNAFSLTIYLLSLPLKLIFYSSSTAITSSTGIATTEPIYYRLDLINSMCPLYPY
ncbi:Sec20-domain-containing protein [Neoconidiobolus thromboides FSU 785]|nr:Sec20-domain-containing protein [Neoconidiobolus thromboides FSU 785]